MILLLAGCGGSGGGSEEVVDSYHEPVPIAFSPSSGYNGVGRAFKGTDYRGTSSGTTVDATTVASTSDGVRTFEVTLPRGAFEDGESFALGQNGTSATYTQTDGRRWRAVAGTVKTDEVMANDMGASLHDARFVADSPDARGEFVADGDFYLAYGKDEGPGTVAFSSDGSSSTNVTRESFGKGATAFYSTFAYHYLAVNELRPDGNRRMFRLYLPHQTKVGDVGTFPVVADDSSENCNLTYGEGIETSPKEWYAESGSWRIVSQSRSNVQIELIDVVMKALPASEFSSATGSFRLNGILRR